MRQLGMLGCMLDFFNWTLRARWNRSLFSSPFPCPTCCECPRSTGQVTKHWTIDGEKWLNSRGSFVNESVAVSWGRLSCLPWFLRKKRRRYFSPQLCSFTTCWRWESITCIIWDMIILVRICWLTYSEREVGYFLLRSLKQLCHGKRLSGCLLKKLLKLFWSR